MGYPDIITFLKAMYLPSPPEPTPKTVEEIETFFRSFNTVISGYKFDRDDANAR